MPKRIQRQRTRGWRMPPDTVYVGRGSQWGNPWRVGRDGDAAYCIEQYRRLITGVPVEAWPNDQHDTETAVLFSPGSWWVRHRLRGKNLACWCPLDRPCHADVLLEIANR